jgi:hypothetical protein
MALRDRTAPVKKKGIPTFVEIGIAAAPGFAAATPIGWQLRGCVARRAGRAACSSRDPSN